MFIRNASALLHFLKLDSFSLFSCFFLHLLNPLFFPSVMSGTWLLTLLCRKKSCHYREKTQSSLWREVQFNYVLKDVISVVLRRSQILASSIIWLLCLCRRCAVSGCRWKCEKGLQDKHLSLFLKNCCSVQSSKPTNKPPSPHLVHRQLKINITLWMPLDWWPLKFWCFQNDL